MTEQQYLENILEKQKVSEFQMSLIRQKRDEIESYLRLEFGNKVENFYYSGSIARGTAISEKFDVDLCVYFSYDSFETLQNMYDSVKNILNKKYVIKEQRVSIGLPSMNIDVVPGRKINSEGVINLWDNKNKTRKQTNIVLHKKYISDNGDKDVIKLLKLWKIRHNIDIKSFALEILSIRALASFSGTGLGNKLRHIWNHINNTDIYSMQIIDPANANNNIMDSVDDFSKSYLKERAKTALNTQYWENIIW